MSGRHPDEGEDAARGEEEAKLFDDLRRTAVDGLVEVLADIHRTKQRRDDAAEQHTRRHAPEAEGRPRLEIDGGETTGDFLFDLARLQMGIVKSVLEFHRR